MGIRQAGDSWSPLPAQYEVLMSIFFFTIVACLFFLVGMAFYLGFSAGLVAQADRFEERWEAGQQIGEAVAEEKKLLGQQDTP